jgi:hypothetical protein
MLLDRGSVRGLFLTIVVRAKGRYRFRIWNFCIMGNHIHFLIEPAKGESLSAVMQWILGEFAMSYNRRCGLTGHVWGSASIPASWKGSGISFSPSDISMRTRSRRDLPLYLTSKPTGALEASPERATTTCVPFSRRQEAA